MYHVCSYVVGWVVVVVCVELGSRAGLFEPAVYEFAFHGIPFRFRSVEPGHVAREVVLPSLGWSSFVCGIFFCLVHMVGFQLERTLPNGFRGAVALEFCFHHSLLLKLFFAIALCVGRVVAHQQLCRFHGFVSLSER